MSKKIESPEKEPKRIDEEADGKKELDFGNEELDKDGKSPEAVHAEMSRVHGGALAKDRLKGGLGDKKKISDFCPEQVRWA